MLDNIQSRIYGSELSNELSMDWEWLSVNGGWLLSIHLNWYEQGGEDPEPVIPEDAYEKMNQAVENAFGDMEPGEYDPDWRYGEGYGNAVG